MKSKVHFTKMHGIGNDYIYINCMESCPVDLPSLSREMSDRHKGIGGDGIILILPSDKADFKMRIFNADGSEAKMCGNGSRCVAKFIHDFNLSDANPIHLETLAGIKVLSLIMDPATGEVDRVTVDMGLPVWEPKLVPVKFAGERMMMRPVSVGQTEVMVSAVSMGNPHGVVIVDRLDENTPVSTLGPVLETHDIWPDRANIEFVKVSSPDEISMRVWERGSGETMACGTGACASAVVCHEAGLTGRKVRVHLLGGDLDIEIAADGHVMMTGPASTVFTGIYDRPWEMIPTCGLNT
ncbi:MAG: diaminopimelate epimerase [Duncaniella sp.]|nr:diaminopimelate epimerase [Duncaniella sp.]